ncbi:hydroxymethylglutaryl-CoA synthase [Methanocella sp. CWC-04]|uniref:Hydroxymethylglutaryl-CoA synthase n=1 Tax=Methanooceanicella nereidis TaxID=2052831 RepID=A0AAP2REA1_9EURY|nr:hydroxymethylglutaryl-CoA synthase [Methanocella sp. CWC-04]MCD1296086.1 hydroxymethylglutaryl-CoA synthase [Methanocella sp. CWC-04]
MKLGISSYGAYVPQYRIKVDEIAKVWGDNADDYKNGLMVTEKSVPDVDEDAATIAVEAARNAMARGADAKKIGAIYVGSESHPYAVKPTATIVAAAIGAPSRMTAADFEFACKAGTAAVQAGMGVVAAGIAETALAIGSDVSQGAPGDALEYTAAAGGAAFVISKNDLIAVINDTCSFTTDTPDFWRREGADYPRHGGRFTGEPGYFKHVTSAAKMLLEKTKTKPTDYTYAVFHQPNGKFPTKAAQMLGFTKEQIKPGLTCPKMGNTYSGASMVGLAATLDIAKPGDRIFVTSFGSGAGSDSFDITVTERINEVRDLAPKVWDYINNAKYIDYATYAKHKGKINIDG